MMDTPAQPLSPGISVRTSSKTPFSLIFIFSPIHYPPVPPHIFFPTDPLQPSSFFATYIYHYRALLISIPPHSLPIGCAPILVHPDVIQMASSDPNRSKLISFSLSVRDGCRPPFMPLRCLAGDFMASSVNNNSVTCKIKYIDI